jgi:hypothetical protein
MIRIILLSLIFSTMCFGQMLKKPTKYHKEKLPTKFEFMNSPTIGTEDPKPTLSFKPLPYIPNPTIVNLLPYSEVGILNRIKVTVKIGFNRSANLDLIEHDVSSFAAYNWRIKYRINHRWACMINIQTIGINGFTNGTNYSAGFFVRF